MPSPSILIRGFDAEVVIEVKLRHGVLRIPIGDLSTYIPSDLWGSGEIRIPLQPGLETRVSEALNEAKCEFGG